MQTEAAAPPPAELRAMEQDAKNLFWHMSTQEAWKEEALELTKKTCFGYSFCLMLCVCSGFVEQSPGLHSCKQRNAATTSSEAFNHPLLCLPNQGHNLITKAQLPKAQSKAQNYFSWWQVKQVFLFAVSTSIYQTGPSLAFLPFQLQLQLPLILLPLMGFFPKAQSKLKDKSDVSTLVRFGHFFHLQSSFSQLIPEQDEPIRRLSRTDPSPPLIMLLHELPWVKLPLFDDLPTVFLEIPELEKIICFLAHFPRPA